MKNGSTVLAVQTMASTSEVLQAIANERERQEKKWGEQNHRAERWLTIAAEEVGEVGRAILEDAGSEADADQIEAECIQTAAVFVAMVESLRRARRRAKAGA